MSWFEAYRQFRGGFREAIDERFYSIEWLDEQVALSRAFFWHTENAAIVAEIKTYPTGTKAIHGLCATGDIKDITDKLIPAAEAWGRENGCTFALIESRSGWGRALKPNGYAVHQTAVGKEI